MDIIDWETVNWMTVIIYSVLAFIAALVANLLNAVLGDNRVFGALLAGVLFGAAYIGWTYYPHGIELGDRIPLTERTTTDQY